MRAEFKEKKAVSIDLLTLDEKNPRLGFAKDQDAVLARMIAYGQPFFALAKDIAESGLSIEPVVVQNDGNKYKVRDGNRRISALKLLNRPHLCPDKASRDRFTKLAEIAEQNGHLLSKIDCMVGASDDAINAYIWRAHTGENGGLGRKNWESLQQEFYLLSIGEKGAFWKAAKLVLWADENDLEVSEGFSVTTLGRYFNAAKNIRLLGFDFDAEDNIFPIVPLFTAVLIVKKIIGDIESGFVHVKRGATPGTMSLMGAADRDLYIAAFRRELKLDSVDVVDPVPGANGTGARPAASQAGQPGGNGTSVDAGGSKPEAGPAQAGTPEAEGANVKGGKNGTTPATHSSLRKKYVTRALHPLEMPTGEQKIRDIYKELQTIEKCPIAGMMLVRAFVESTFRAFVRRNELMEEGRIDGASIKDMLRFIRKKLIDDSILVEGTGSDLFQKVELMAQNSIVTVPTMQKFIHSEMFNPKDADVIRTWDEFYHFLKLLWQLLAARA
ncbi:MULTISPECIES: ParB/Srx family N-terminal domain-containing protein [Pseudomonas]|uniref:Uncharacterized protein n=1 Tax=Pseudomonas umsongensis TaxID=198618 RepID=A0ACC5MEI4_9PSED|nr:MULTISPECIES: ParB/Srx family N-terminal domain-containing protein [Pseudomonas]MBB2886995.1 hypothetical protein [Pseudomonas umsongensis]